MKERVEPFNEPPTHVRRGWPHAATVDDADPPSGGWTERLNDWMTPGIRIKRWVLLLMVASVLGAFSLLAFFWMSPLRAVMSSFIYRAQLWLLESISSPWLVALALVVLAAAAAIYGIVQINRTLLWAAGMEPKHVARAMSGQHTLSRGPASWL
ncbi:hypothetical protein [Deinococcus radiophilus]|uniref:hypothetical protein n=1 Tax=Deinococcus radiophilus TaxID=32062 RepID=UPI0036094B27